MGFYIAKADTAGAKITASEVLLSPGPTDVEYPVEAAGSIVMTASGSAIQQQPVRDSRVRAWVWRGYPGYWVLYQTLFDQLKTLRATTRYQLGAATPYIYLKDTETRRMFRRAKYTGTTTGSSANSLTDGTAAFPGSNGLAGFAVELISGTGAGQQRTVLSNTGTSLTITQNWAVNPSSTVYGVVGDVHDWFRCRVVDVQQKVRDGGGLVRYEETRLSFVIDDVNYNVLG
jgi:hypothetical protein